ncbi:MAG TPA: globin domain-containing protein [Thermoanaerobaculia bacterium]|nr:globin domain-containing protein [Thermoanaerobaculia bacterium]
MTEDDIALFNDSLERCTADPRFLPRFYDIFMASSEEVRQKFEKTDFKRQHRMLKASLFLLVVAAEGRPEGKAHLDEMAVRHGPGQLGIRPEMYDLWYGALLRAVREIDASFSPKTEQAWDRVLHLGIDYLKERAAATP